MNDMQIILCVINQYVQLYTVFRKKHPLVVLYLHEWRVDLNKNCSEQ